MKNDWRTLFDNCVTSAEDELGINSDKYPWECKMYMCPT